MSSRYGYDHDPARPGRGGRRGCRGGVSSGTGRESTSVRTVAVVSDDRDSGLESWLVTGAATAPAKMSSEDRGGCPPFSPMGSSRISMWRRTVGGRVGTMAAAQVFVVWPRGSKEYSTVQYTALNSGPFDGDGDKCVSLLGSQM